MPDGQDPFERYIAQVARHLARLHPEQQAVIADELRAHLEDAAAAHGEQAENPTVRVLIVSQMGAPRRVGRALAKVHTTASMRQYARQALILVRAIVAGLAATICLMFLFLCLMAVPAPNPDTATPITGTVARITEPHPDYGDMSIILQDGRRFYVNRANEVEYFAWKRLLDEVRAGDRIHLTAVEPLAWRLWSPQDPGRSSAFTPVAGVRTSTVVYMDERISARTWSTVTEAQQMALIAFAIVCLCFVPEMFRGLRRRIAV